MWGRMKRSLTCWYASSSMICLQRAHNIHSGVIRNPLCRSSTRPWNAPLRPQCSKKPCQSASSRAGCEPYASSSCPIIVRRIEQKHCHIWGRQSKFSRITLAMPVISHPYGTYPIHTRASSDGTHDSTIPKTSDTGC